MNHDILNELINQLLANISIWNTVKSLLGTIVPAIFTCFGTSLKNIQRFISLIGFTKNIRACKYVILSKVWDDSFKDYLKKLGVFFLEIFTLIINIFVIVGVVEIFVVFANIRVENISNKSGSIILLSIMVGTIIVTAFLGKRSYSKLYIKVMPIVFVFCEGVLFIMLFTLSAHNIEKKLGVLAIVSILFMAAIIITLHRCGIYKNYKYPFVIVCRGIRHFILILYSCYYFIKLQVIHYNKIIWAWMILCCIEFIWIEIKDTDQIAHVTLHTKNGKKVTKDKIVQYEENKIGYKLLNGKEEIVDDDEIEMITYQKKYWFRKNYKAKHTFECKLRNGNILKYQDYQLIRASWVSFFNIENGIKDVVILKIRDTEKITEN